MTLSVASVTRQFLLQFYRYRGDVISLQDDLDKVYSWADTIGMVFNAYKDSCSSWGKVFNSLPKNLRNENSGDFALFKNNLDIFLVTIPDQAW